MPKKPITNFRKPPPINKTALAKVATLGGTKSPAAKKMNESIGSVKKKTQEKKMGSASSGKAMMPKKKITTTTRRGY